MAEMKHTIFTCSGPLQKCASKVGSFPVSGFAIVQAQITPIGPASAFRQGTPCTVPTTLDSEADGRIKAPRNLSKVLTSRRTIVVNVISNRIDQSIWRVNYYALTDTDLISLTLNVEVANRRADEFVRIADEMFAGLSVNH